MRRAMPGVLAAVVIIGAVLLTGCAPRMTCHEEWVPGIGLVDVCERRECRDWRGRFVRCP